MTVAQDIYFPVRKRKVKNSLIKRFQNGNWAFSCSKYQLNYLPFTIQFYTWFPDVISIVDRVDNFKNPKNCKTYVAQLALLQNLTVSPYY